MNKKYVIELVAKLDWRLPEEIQKKAADELKSLKVNDWSDIIQPSMKETWHNCVQLLKEIGYPKNKTALPQLIWLLSDINWPGAWGAVEILISLEKKDLLPLVKHAINRAYMEQDAMWLGGIKILIRKAKLEGDLSDKSFCEMLDLADF